MKHLVYCLLAGLCLLDAVATMAAPRLIVTKDNQVFDTEQRAYVTVPEQWNGNIWEEDIAALSEHGELVKEDTVEVVSDFEARPPRFVIIGSLTTHTRYQYIPNQLHITQFDSLVYKEASVHETHYPLTIVALYGVFVFLLGFFIFALAKNRPSMLLYCIGIVGVITILSFILGPMGLAITWCILAILFVVSVFSETIADKFWFNSKRNRSPFDKLGKCIFVGIFTLMVLMSASALSSMYSMILVGHQNITLDHQNTLAIYYLTGVTAVGVTLYLIQLLIRWRRARREPSLPINQAAQL